MQIKRELTKEMFDYIELKRDWIRDHCTPESIDKYNTFQGKLHLLDTILKSSWIEKHEKAKLQSLGITLGDVFVQEMNFEWMEIEDEHGLDPAIRLQDTSLILFPMTMISKRIEKGEVVDIYELYESVKSYINDVKSNPDLA